MLSAVRETSALWPSTAKAVSTIRGALAFPFGESMTAENGSEYEDCNGSAPLLLRDGTAVALHEHGASELHTR